MERTALTSGYVVLHSKIKKKFLRFNRKIKKRSFSLDKNFLVQNCWYFCTYIKRKNFKRFLLLRENLYCPCVEVIFFPCLIEKYNKFFSLRMKSFLSQIIETFLENAFPLWQKSFHSKMEETLPLSGIDDLTFSKNSFSYLHFTDVKYFSFDYHSVQSLYSTLIIQVKFY